MTKLLWRKCRLCGVSEWKHVCPVVMARAQKPAGVKFDETAYQREYMRKYRAKKRAKAAGMSDEEVRRVFGPIADVLAGRAP